MKHTILFVVSFLFILPLTAGEYVYLSDLNEEISGKTYSNRGIMKDEVKLWDHGTLKGSYPIKLKDITYEKGIHLCPNHNAKPTVKYSFSGQRYSRFSCKIGITDYYKEDGYEWAQYSNGTSSNFTVSRPPGGYGGNETDRHVRIGAGASITIAAGVGSERTVIHETGEFYRYQSDVVEVDVDITGMNFLYLIFDPSHTEKLDAAHRNGLPQEVSIQGCCWFDDISLADAKLTVDMGQTSISDRQIQHLEILPTKEAYAIQPILYKLKIPAQVSFTPQGKRVYTTHQSAQGILIFK